MEEQKRVRLIAAFTVNIVLLIVILAAVAVYQLVVIVNLSERRRQMLEDIEYYTQKIESSTDDLEYLQSEEYLRDLAFRYGYYWANP